MATTYVVTLMIASFGIGYLTRVYYDVVYVRRYTMMMARLRLRVKASESDLDSDEQCVRDLTRIALGHNDS